VQSWQARIDPNQRPIYLAIAAAIEAAIDSGEVRDGDRLPSHRALAASLDIDLTTASRGYSEARRRGLLRTGTGRGTFVRADPAPAQGQNPSVIDMSMNQPPQPQDPALRQLLRDGLTNLLRHCDIATLMAYRGAAGSDTDRAAGARWLRPVIGEVPADRLAVCAGGQAALAALVTMLARPGDTILAESLTYPRVRALATQCDIRLEPVATDADGMLPDDLDRACRQFRPKAIYCIPTMHNPTTVTTPPARRQALAELALRHGVPLIEDDAYGMLPSAPIAAITSLAHGVGYYVASTSKCLSPGLRVAYVVAPDAASTARLVAALRATSLMAPPLMTGLVSAWIDDGTAAAYRDAVRAEAAGRQRIAQEILPPGGFAAHPEGLHVWLTLPADWNGVDFWAHARRLGLPLVPGETFMATPNAPNTPNGVRISLGAATSRTALRTALQGVVGAMHRDDAALLADIV
jgi:DNA-binding transcriptional MocR family regulator